MIKKKLIKQGSTCPQCNAISVFLKNFHDKDDLDKLKNSLYKCSNCKLYFFNRDNYNQQIYKDYKLSTNKQKPRHKLLSKLISKTCRKGSILEVGAGSAHILKLLDDTKYNFSIIDYQKPNFLPKNTSFFNGGIEEVSVNLFDNGSFNLIIMDNLIEHLPNPQNAIKKISKWMTKDGYMCVSVPNRWNIKNFLALRSNNEFYHSSEHINIYTKKSLNYLFYSNNYKLVRKWILPYDIFSLFNIPSLLGFPLFGIYFLYQKK